PAEGSASPGRPGRKRRHVVRAPSEETAYGGWPEEDLRELAEARDVQVGNKASRTAILTALSTAGIEEPDVMRRMHEVRAIPLPEAEDDLVRELRQTVDSEFATAVRRGMLLANLRERCGGDDQE